MLLFAKILILKFYIFYYCTDILVLAQPILPNSQNSTLISNPLGHDEETAIKYNADLVYHQNLKTLRTKNWNSPLELRENIQNQTTPMKINIQSRPTQKNRVKREAKRQKEHELQTKSNYDDTNYKKESINPKNKMWKEIPDMIQNIQKASVSREKLARAKSKIKESRMRDSLKEMFESTKEKSMPSVPEETDKIAKPVQTPKRQETIAKEEDEYEQDRSEDPPEYDYENSDDLEARAKSRKGIDGVDQKMAAGRDKKNLNGDENKVKDKLNTHQDLSSSAEKDRQSDDAWASGGIEAECDNNFQDKLEDDKETSFEKVYPGDNTNLAGPTSWDYEWESPFTTKKKTVKSENSDNNDYKEDYYDIESDDEHSGKKSVDPGTEEQVNRAVRSNKEHAEKVWDGWGKWSKCSATCGTGKTSSWRHCLHGACEVGDKEVRIKLCNTQPCP